MFEMFHILGACVVNKKYHTANIYQLKANDNMLKYSLETPSIKPLSISSYQQKYMETEPIISS